PGPGKKLVGCVAQRLEGFGKADRRQRLEHLLRRCAAGRRRNWREHRDVRFVEVGKDADAGEGILAPRDGGSAFGADGGDVALNETVLERRGGAARRFNLLKELPGRAAKLISQIFNSAGA